MRCASNGLADNNQIEKERSGRVELAPPREAAGGLYTKVLDILITT
jgi:hypothetical protein